VIDPVDAATRLGEAEPPGAARPALPRWIAALEAVMVSGLPTQLIIVTTVALFAGRPLVGSREGVPLGLFVAVGLVDTLLVTALILLFLRQSGEHPRTVLFGAVPAWPEIRRGLFLVPAAFLAVTLAVLLLRLGLPWLRTVPENPLAAYLDTPVRAAAFFIVAVIAGGVREELQRAFILHRFEQRLGGMRVGIGIFTVAFALQHIEQGADVAVAVGLLALWWGSVYARRRSVWMPMANHAGFNALQVLQAIVARAAGAVP
jgi:membrane protease YdiL (CAAX protease family)